MTATDSETARALRVCRAFDALRDSERRGYWWTVRSSQLLDPADPDRCWIVLLRRIGGKASDEVAFRWGSPEEVMEAAARHLREEERDEAIDSMLAELGAPSAPLVRDAHGAAIDEHARFFTGVAVGLGLVGIAGLAVWLVARAAGVL